MKIIIKLLVLIIIPTIANAQNKKNWSPKVSIFSTIYGISDFKGSNLPLISVGLDWMAGKKVYYYGKLQYNYRIGNHTSAPEQFISPMSLQIKPIGVGFYLLDTRKKDLSTGWSMVMNIAFGLGVNFGVQDGYVIWADMHLKSWENMMQIIGMLFYVPIELSLYTRYHINTASAVQLGVNISGHFGAYNRLLYGFTFGFVF